MLVNSPILEVKLSISNSSNKGGNCTPSSVNCSNIALYASSNIFRFSSASLSCASKDCNCGLAKGTSPEVNISLNKN